METGLLGKVLDSSVLIAAERRKLTAGQSIESIRNSLGEIPLIFSPITIAEIGHDIYRGRLVKGDACFSMT